MVKFRRTFWILVILSLLSIASARLVGDVLFYRAFYFWIGLLVISFVWTISSLQGVELKRSSRELLKEVGEIFEEKYSIENTSRIGKTWIGIQDRSTLVYSNASRILTRIPRNVTKQYTTYSHLLTRGKYLLGPTVLSGGDIFGIFRIEKEIPARESLLVSPLVFEINEPLVQGTIMSGGRSSREKGYDTNAFASGLREYLPGDPLKKIHWKSTAKNQQLMVKEYDKDPLTEVLIVVDNGINMQWGHTEVPNAQSLRLFKPNIQRSIYPSSLDYLTSLAASYGKAFLDNGISTGLIYAMDDLVIIPADKGERQYLKVLEQLALMAAGGKGSIFSHISILSKEIRQGSLIMLITATTDESLLLACEELLSRGLVVRVILLDRQSFNIQDGNDVLGKQVEAAGFSIRCIKKAVDIEGIQEQLR